MKTHSMVNDWVQELDIADGLKQLLKDADITIESIVGLGYREVSEILHIDPYVGKLIVEAAQDVMEVKDHGQDLMNDYYQTSSPKPV
jgi:hypothetical protein